jgi:hypothetical protein
MPRSSSIFLTSCKLNLLSFSHFSCIIIIFWISLSFSLDVSMHSFAFLQVLPTSPLGFWLRVHSFSPFLFIIVNSWLTTSKVQTSPPLLCIKYNQYYYVINLYSFPEMFSFSGGTGSSPMSSPKHSLSAVMHLTLEDHLSTHQSHLRTVPNACS